MAGLVQVLGPAAEVISLTEAKAQVRVDDTNSDTLLTALIAAARTYAETFTRRALVLQSFDLSFDGGFPEASELPRPPLRGVTSITYLDAAGASQTLAGADYLVDLARQPGLVVPAYGVSWPATRGVVNDVTVRFNAGYATPFTADATSDVLTASDHVQAAGEAVRLANSGGALPAPLAVNTTYYVRDVAGATLKLAASSGGAAINITDAGTGTQFLGQVPTTIRQAMLMLLGHWFENRETVTLGAAPMAVPLSAEALLWLDRAFLAA
jgi:uncharacterized phiE125 gp8 family phage protein